MNPLGQLRLYAARLRLFSRNVRLLLLGDACIGLGLTFWTLLFNLYLKSLAGELALDPAQTSHFIGRTTALAQAACALFALPAGLLAGRLRHKPMLIASHLLSCAAFLGAILAATPGLMRGFLFFASGFMVVFWVVLGPFTMRNTSPKERTYVFTIAMVLRLVGGVAGNVLAGRIKDLAAAAGLCELDAYRWTILGGLLFSFLAVIPFLRIDEASAAPQHERLTLRGVLGMDWALFVKALLPSTIVMIGAGLIIQFMNLYLKETFTSLKDSHIGLILSLQNLTMVVGMLAAPALAEKLGKVRTIVGAQLASLPFMVALALTADVRVAVAAVAIRATLMNMSNPVANTLLLELCRAKEQGVLSALFAMSGNLAWAIAAVAFGHMEGDYRAMFFIAVGLYFVSTVLYHAFFKDAEAGLGRREAPPAGILCPPQGAD
ncbi:MAG: MFS transporter [Elusimicrobia bacterium]|nr:MFS transporter [Elusimicrobiota bacterium]